VEAQDASLAGAHLAEVVLAEAFTYPTALALSADGAFLAAGTATGEVRLWGAADRTLRLAAQAHSGAVVTEAVSGDGQLLASGSADGTVRLWEAGSGQPLATLDGHTRPSSRIQPGWQRLIPTRPALLPSQLLSCSQRRFRSVETNGHFPPRWPVTLLRSGWSRSPKQLATLARRTHEQRKRRDPPTSNG
jgi:hypothetical protein